MTSTAWRAGRLPLWAWSVLAGGAAVAVLAVGIATWCRSPGDAPALPFRFVDPGLRRPSAWDRLRVWTRSSPALRTATWPTGTILDDTRYVLQAPPHELLVSENGIVVPPDGTLSFAPDLPPALKNSARLTLVRRVKTDRWTVLPGVVVEPRVRGTVRVELPVPQAAGMKVDVQIDAIAIAREQTSTHSTRAIPVPPGAQLSFAIGILEPAWVQGPVTFDLKGCDGARCEPLFSETLDPRRTAGQGWEERVVPLERLAGTTRSFLFETRLASPDNAAFSFPLWANPTVYVPEAASSSQPNLIVLSIDTLGARHLPSYGYPYDTAPFIDETFGRHGTVFNHCVAAAVTTPPSHMTMLTSLPPSVHGLTIGFLQTLPEWVVTLAEALRAAGFETGAVTEDGWLGAEYGFGRGFNSYAENKSPDLMLPAGQVDLTFAKARRWLAQHRRQRFFLFLHTFQVHDPYVPPLAYTQLFVERGGARVTAASPRAVREETAYDQEIRYTDDELRKLFAGLAENDLSNNTVFVLVSDHGEEFFEHGVWGHGTHFYEEVTRVPLMFWGPGIPEGRRVQQPVGHIDLMPTFLDMLRVSRPDQVMGRTFTDLLYGDPDAPRPEVPLFSEAWGGLETLPDYSSRTFDRPGYMLQLGSRKLSRYRRNGTFAYEYYDVATDPQERTNLYVEGANGIAELRRLLDDYEERCKGIARNLATASKLPAIRDSKRVHLDPATEEKLRALGYIK